MIEVHVDGVTATGRLRTRFLLAYIDLFLDNGVAEVRKLRKMTNGRNRIERRRRDMRAWGVWSDEAIEDFTKACFERDFDRIARTTMILNLRRRPQ